MPEGYGFILQQLLLLLSFQNSFRHQRTYLSNHAPVRGRDIDFLAGLQLMGKKIHKVFTNGHDDSYILRSGRCVSTGEMNLSLSSLEDNNDLDETRRTADPL
ncbi:hypothetical protein BDE02_03G108600 [Populus trichocarpa]|nr:hypothetical protein BDE02_03G108600 [Populus trichocarpa]